jgi:outer membrane receptor protein involved in Fe transport
LSNYDVLCAEIARCTNPSSLLEYLPETVKGGEIGAKASLLGGALYGDLTLYRYQYTNLQVTTFDSATLNYFTTNAASSLSEGIEAKLRYNVSHAFQVHGFVGYTDLHYLSFQGAQCYSGQTIAGGCAGGLSQDLTGTAYGGAPWEINLGFNYQRELSQAWGLGLAGDMYCYTRTPRPNNDPFADGGDGYCEGNAALRLYQQQGPLEFAVIAKNLGDYRYVYPAAVGKPLGAPGDLGSVIGPPREVTLQVTYRF